MFFVFDFHYRARQNDEISLTQYTFDRRLDNVAQHPLKIDANVSVDSSEKVRMCECVVCVCVLVIFGKPPPNCFLNKRMCV